MWHFIKEHSKEFWKFFTGGYVVWGGILFSAPPELGGVFVNFLLKAIGAGALAFVTGFFTVAGHYVWKKYIEPKISKNKKDERQEKDAA